ncbi:MAG: M28 family metallopeptidase [Geminicoccaceae bacterium]
MTVLSFMPLSLAEEFARAGRRAVAPSPPIVFGREAVFVDLPDDADAATPLFAAARRALEPGRVLAAVVQKGRLFERAHPDLTVVRRRGRFLLVELEPDHPALTRRTEEPCYAVYRLEPGAEVFRDLGPGDLRPRRDAAVAAVVERLSIATFRDVLEQLVGLRTRLSSSDFYRSAAATCRDRLEALGYAPALQSFPLGDGQSSNVVTAATGAAGTATVLVTGHLDSVNHEGGPEADAPGADDNGSGSAGVIAMAEALQPVREQIAVRFVLFGGEEQGLHGSRHFLARLSDQERAALRAVINMDMIANLNTLPDGTSAPPGVLLEGAEVSREVIDGLAAQAATYTNLSVQTSLSPFASDHVPFIEAGLPGVLTIEGADHANDRIHTAADTFDHIDLGLACQILRMNIAYVASLATS